MVKVGERYSYTRSFSREEVAAFADLSGDHGRHHMEPDGAGRVVVHGLLVISVATRIGADIHYVAHTMNWMFTRPAFSGDAITATLEVTELQAAEGRDALAMNVRICNSDGKVVARGETRGVILHPGATLKS